MKGILKFSLLLLIGAIGYISCTEEPELAVLRLGNAPVIASVLDAAYVLDENRADSLWEEISWSEADFGYDAGITYAIEVDKTASNFATAKEVGKTDKLSLMVTEGMLNNALLSARVDTGTITNVSIRVKASVSDAVDPVYSDPISFDVTPYLQIISYPTLWMPGNYQAASGYTADWSPIDAPNLWSVNSDEKYEGYINIDVDGAEFKFTKSPEWGMDPNIFGDSDPNGTAGTLSNPGNNIKKVRKKGYYRIRADLNALTYSRLKTEWAIIGDATANGWNDPDEDMTYDDVSHTWKITTNLTVGAIKFRANDDWAVNYGDDLPADGVLDFNSSDNIAVSEAGNYTIELFLENPTPYYKLTKN